MEYKQSRYNYIVEDDRKALRLYNSIVGSKSLLIAENEKRIRVQEILQNCNDEKWRHDAVFKKLVELGYIISADFDEVVLGKMRKNDIINSPNLLLTIMPTEDCNFRCKYCYEDHKKGKMSYEVQNAIIKFVQKNICNYTRLGVAWFGGEPLEAIDIVHSLSKRLIKICDVARKTYYAGMTTNGYNLDVDTFKELLDLKVYDYQITIDGLKEIHDQYRCLKNGSGTFEQIVSNLEQIKQIKRNTFKIDVRTNFTRDSMQELEKYLAFCEKLFGGDSRFSLFVHLAEDWGGDKVKTLQSKLISNDRYAELLQAINLYQPMISFNAHVRDLEPSFSKCYAALRNSYVIGSDGAIYKCTEDFDMPENRIGYLNENGEMIIDQVKHAKWVDCISEMDKNSCNVCSYWGNCLDGPCPKAKIQANDSKKQSFCPRTKHSVKEIMLLLEKPLFEEL